jgi:type 1 glutamine amidotransferase
MTSQVIAFTRTSAYRHDSIPAGVAALAEMGALHGFRVTATEDPDVFTGAALRGTAAVVFLNTSGTVLDDPHRAALEAYVRAGGGFVGVHCAAFTEPDWGFYGELIGARFVDHPDVQPATVRVTDRDHPATGHLARGWTRVDEWYNFDRNPRPDVRVLACLDESSYQGGTMGADHPIAWCHTNLGGRACYTALGHTIEAYAEPALRAHLAGAVTWASRPDPA